MNVNDTKGMKFDVDPCTTKKSENNTLRGYKMENNCNCNSCTDDSLCHYDKTNSFPFLYGFGWISVLIVYSVVGVLTVIITLTKNKYAKKTDNESESRSSSNYNYKNAMNTVTTSTNNLSTSN